MAVDTRHPEHKYFNDIWTMIDDFSQGEKQVKSKKINYLMKNPEWTDLEYLDYLIASPFTNFSSRSINALLGAMFLKDPQIKLPQSIEYLHKNSDGKNNGLLQLVRRMSVEAIKKGRSGLYVDFPKVVTTSGSTASIKDTEGLQANLALYDARNIINWKEDEEGLTMVVLEETYACPDALLADEFSTEMKVQYRVLKRVNGVFSVTVYRNKEAYDTFTPKDYYGKPLSYIPFFFNGSVNNDAECDTPPVYEIVSKNKSHYQLEAEIMRSIRLVGAPMLTISMGEIQAEQFLALNDLNTDDGTERTLKFGSSRGLILGTGGRAELIQAEANGMAQTKADNILSEAIMLGARLVTKSAGRMTAEQVRIESSAETGVITSIAKNIEDALTNALTAVQQMMSPTFEPMVIVMNTEFIATSPDAQVLMFASQMTDLGRIAPVDMFDILKRSGLISSERTFEEVNGEAEEYLNKLQKEAPKEVETNKDMNPMQMA